MRRALALTLLFGGSVVMAQAPQGGPPPVPNDGSVPAPSNVQSSPYPRINTNGTVTFRMRADAAAAVSVNLPDFGAVPLAKGEGGFWFGTTDKPVPPGFYYYTVNVDGFTSNDLGSQTFYGYSRYGSALEVPGPDSALWARKDVPHGVVREQYYFSKSRNEWRRIRVYTPPDYDTNGRARYPVLYLQHGAGENELGWTTQGHANFILDNLLAEKKIRPMIVVNENGIVPAAPAAPGANAPAAGRGGGTVGNTFAELDAVMTRDLIPFVDATYRTLANRESRALAGLSLGGAQTLRIGLNHLDLFSYLGMFSPAAQNVDPATAYEGRLKDAASVNKQLRLLWIGIGTEDRLYAGVKVTHENLLKAGINHTWVETSGGHVWPVWRKYLAEFTPLLFR